MSDTTIYVATIWDDATSFGSPRERRWFSADDAARNWLWEQISSGSDRWHVESVECGDEPGEKE